MIGGTIRVINSADGSVTSIRVAAFCFYECTATTERAMEEAKDNLALQIGSGNLCLTNPYRAIFGNA
ncbi:MAG: hypothetical protein LBI39_01585 [Puniceicoccales bacterium]|nr:hypothetical protein [Puniceicoccales bacterium]